MSIENHSFQGFSEETFRFFWDIAFHNETSYYLANKDRYYQTVKYPLLALASELSEPAKAFDNRFITEPLKVISRLRRDTRYTKDKSPYRDHAWIGYKLPEQRTGESLSLYFEIGRTGYGFGLGMYCPNTQLMAMFRSKIEKAEETFISLTTREEFRFLFTVEGESYKKNRFSGKPAELQPWLNRKNFSFCFSSDKVSNTMSRDLLHEIEAGFHLLKPVYDILMNPQK